jgi:hypothetical protein
VTRSKRACCNSKSPAPASAARREILRPLVEPPKRPTLADIPGREFIFLLDVSGSMHGFPIDTSKELMRNLLPKLRPTDHFNIACFSGANYVWSPSGSRRPRKPTSRKASTSSSSSTAAAAPS